MSKLLGENGNKQSPSHHPFYGWIRIISIYLQRVRSFSAAIKLSTSSIMKSIIDLWHIPIMFIVISWDFLGISSLFIVISWDLLYFTGISDDFTIFHWNFLGFHHISLRDPHFSWLFPPQRQPRRARVAPRRPRPAPHRRRRQRPRRSWGPEVITLPGKSFPTKNH